MHVPKLPLVATTALLSLAACSGSGSSSSEMDMGDPGVSGTPDFTVFADGSDPRLLAAVYPSGQQVQFFGQRGFDGLPTGLYAITVESASGAAQFDLDGEGRPVRMVSVEGERYLLDWASDGQSAALTAISPDGTFQISTDLNFLGVAGLSTGDDAWNLADGASRAVNRIGISATGQARFGYIDPDSIPQILGGSTGAGQVQTLVSVCGIEAAGNLSVVTSVRDADSGELALSVPALYLGGGLYSAAIPSGQVTLQNDEPTCTATASVLDLACLALDGIGGSAAFSTQLCASLAAAIDVITGGPGGEGVYVFEGCEALLGSLDLYCSTLGQGAAPGTPPLADQLCTAVFQDAALPAELTIESCVVALPAGTCSLPLSVPSNVSFPVMNSIDLGMDSAIQSLVLVPSAPAAGEGYVATARITCLPAGSNVRMDIVGTDGYTDEVNFPVAATQAEGSFDLGVPGAAQGVQDTVTADLELPGGSVLTRTAFLVFGS